MKYIDIYHDLSNMLGELYDPREGATIARYLIEDFFQTQFWSEDEVSTAHATQLYEIKKRLAKHEPWQYIGGIADFYGMKFSVNSSVLIPRPETEELVAIALDIMKEHSLERVLDIGTGSGIIPITIAKKQKNSRVVGLDISDEALAVSRANGLKHDVDVAWLSADFLDRSSWSDLPIADVVISNPPYIHPSERSTMDANVIDHEPSIALFVNDDLMEFYEALSSFVMEHQEIGCFLIVEIHEAQGDNVMNLFAAKGLTALELVQDMQGKDRIVVGRK
jgi:release factor glutamine methyltransferase